MESRRGAFDREDGRRDPVEPDRVGADEGGERSGTLGRSLRRRLLVAGVMVAIAAAIVLVLAFSRSSGGGSEHSDDPLDGSGRDSYLAALEAAARTGRTGGAGRVSSGKDVAADQERCLAKAVVDGIGVGVLRDVGTPRELVETVGGPAAALAHAGVKVDDRQRDAVYAAAQRCGDLRDRFIAQMGQGVATFPPAIVRCMRAHLDDRLLRDIVLTELIEGDGAFVHKPELTAAVSALGRACAAV